MKIIIYGINYTPELVGIGKYTGEMGAWLSKEGYKVHVITAPPYYPGWRVHSNFSQWLYSRTEDGNLTIWRCPLFVPSRPNAVLRILHLASFALTSMPILMSQLFWKPNIIFIVAPTIFCAPGALILAKLAGAKSILHIQDFEVDALFGLDLASGGLIGSFLKKIAFSFESFMIKSFDIVSTISEGMLQRARDKGGISENIRFLPNWSEISRFQNIKTSPELLHGLGVPKNKKIILYSGNMGEKQGLENVLFAAQSLDAEKSLVFLFIGDGASRNRLVKMVTDLNLTNVIFAPLQSYEDLPLLLASADVHLIVQKRGVADAVLPSKLTNILAVGGNAIITADSTGTLGKLPFDYPGIALIVEPESVDALVSGIKRALFMPKPNLIAQGYAREFLDKEQVLTKYFKSIL